MAKRMNKITPVAATVALSLGLAGCGSDNDNNVSVTPAVTYTSSGTASFNTEITGKAVKGSMYNAVVSVTTLNDAGESVDVAYRLAPSTEAETFSGSALSQEEADSQVAEAILAANPDSSLTDENGTYSIYLEDDFTGPVYITVTASAEGDDSLVRCDSYTGCGTYAQADEPALPNDGDLNIEFGEWYKADVELSVVKYITATDSDSGSALGDEGVTTTYTANATVLTSIVADLLLGSAVDSTAIADASLQTVIQILGPDAAITLGPILGDLSTSGGTDLSNPDGSEELDSTNLLMAQFSASIQGMTGQSVNALITSFQSGVSAGSVSGSADATIAALAVSLQNSITNTVNIFTAVASGDSTAIQSAYEAAFLVNNPAATEDEIAAYSAQAATEVTKALAARDAAISSGSTTAEALVEAAEEAKKAVEVIGCTTNCEVGDTFYADLAATIELKVAASEVTLTTIEDMVAQAQTDLAAAQLLNDTDVIVDEATALEFTAAVDALQTYSTAANLLVKTTRLATTSNGYISVANTLVAQSSDYQSLLDSANTLLTGAVTENAKVIAFNSALAALVLEADAVKAEYDVVVASARNNANMAYANAQANEDLVNTAESDSTSALSSAMSGMLDNAENAAAALLLAETAVTESSEFISAVNTFETSISQAKVAAASYAAVAESDDDVAAAAALVESADAFESATQSQLASEQFADATALKDAAEAAVAKFAALESVVAATDSVSMMTVLTHTGAESVVDAAELIADVIDEVADMGQDASGTSTRDENWTYDYSVEELRFSLENATTGEMITANASYEGDKLVLAWGATLVAESGASIEFVTQDSASAALTECVAFDTSSIVGSCLVVTFDADVTADNVDDAEVVMTQSYNNVVITDGDSGFVGTLSHSTDEVAMIDTATLAGMSGDVDFSVMGTYDYMDSTAETDTLEIMVNSIAGESAMGYHLSVMRTESEDFAGTISADYADSTMVFGTVTEVTNGISVTYIDNTTVEYTDVTLVDMTK
jgi:uncharacterized metal-binding protein